jgi:cytochrome P450
MPPTLPDPRDPIAAATHPDPYPYYADLVARRPLYRDAALGLWIASSADAVAAVLSSDLCRVRPAGEPVPEALLASPAAEIFRRLVRMNDGPGHGPFKHAVTATLASLDAGPLAEACDRWARVLAGEPDFAFRLPLYVIASLLGVPESELERIAAWTGDFVRCLAPASGAEPIERGKVAAGHLLDRVGSLLRDRQAAHGLLAVLAREARLVGRDDFDAVVANGIGFLTQAYEATAGLIGNTLVALASHDDVRERVAAAPALLSDVVQEVLRYDPPIQNTRRFLAEDGVVAGHAMKKGDAVLVVLAAANRDPSANPDPQRFDIARARRRVFTFGTGVHACPGQSIAAAIAEAGVRQWMASGIDLTRLAGPVAYRPSANARIPLFTRPA